MHYFLAFLLFHLFISGAGAGSPAYTPPDYFLLNCGASSSQQFQGRTWETDNFTTFIPPNAAHISLTFTAIEQGPSVPQVPYTTGVRIFTSQFTYSFPVSAGPKFLRLYFHAAHFPPAEFDLTKSFFSVRANEYTLLSNFSAYLTSVDSLVQKEYIVNVNDNYQKLNITFTPSSSSYAFVNGIEIVSIPTGYYIKGEAAGVDPVKWVPGANNFYIFNNTALETLYRLNIGGQTLPAINDTGMYRTWYSDDEYVIGYGYYTPDSDVNITYTSLTPSYSAPEIVYTSARTIAHYSSSVNWSFPLDSGFLYLFRLYFCEFQKVDGGNERVFSVDIANTTAERHVDVFILAGGSNIPIFQDYVVIVPDKDGRRSKQDVWFSISPNMDTRPVYANAILNGLEIFKLNDTQGSLAALNPQLSLPAKQSSPPPPPLKKKSRTVVVGAIVGGGVAVIMSLGILIFRRRRVGNFTPSFTKISWDILPAVSAAVRMRGRLGSSSLSSHHHNFPLEDLKSATGDFDENLVIGKGGFGKVYRGILDINGAPITVAIKRLNPESRQGAREFETEIEMLSKLRHIHIVSFIGYCNENKEMIIVYDYMGGGTLRDHLYKTNNPSLPWKKRLEICIGAAKGLHFLHTGTKCTIIHRDIKSSNILLDDKWVAKVSDFGLSKVGPICVGETQTQTHVSTAVKGSVGYVDPEYYRRRQLTEKSDVYSFGVVLFEALCARPAVDPTLTREKANLAEWGRKCCRKGMVDQMVDSRLRDEISPECLKSYAEIAYKCLMDEGVERPAMSDVICSLEFALQLQEKADGFLSTSLHRDTESNTASEISGEGIFSSSGEFAPKL
ncbi:receptor-like protein kinase FERONIA [Ipomoea triloba]|uniref:receptor-like protein kinase FERONIA n=1 Tax=Ipomoea triloba TaxID=35885 RepID=UPI00125E2EC5|nr:receptor-like protein kinase FERONIA [Ipomoea triloba]